MLILVRRYAVALGLASIALLLSISTTDAAVLCAQQRKNGSFNSKVAVRERCRKKEKQLDLAALGLTAPSGSQGAKGDPGSQGPKGDPGSQARSQRSVWEGRRNGVFALRAYQPSARRVYQPAGLP